MCGIVGVFDTSTAAQMTALGLHALQHRGQEAAGVAASDGATLRYRKGSGLVKDVLVPSVLEPLKGTLAVGHCRYPTVGGTAENNAQPLYATCRGEPIAIVHNGDLVGASLLRDDLEMRGAIFSTTSDTEVILHLIAKSSAPTLIERVADALLAVRGAYSLLILSRDTIIAARDPHGFRPLVLGEVDGATVFASESCAIDFLGGKVVREIEPGEVVSVSPTGMVSRKPFPAAETHACVFEHIYFARPDSTMFGESVYQARFQWGKELADVAPVPADIVISVPDSGNPAALGYAAGSGIPFGHGLIRSHYGGRTFLASEQAKRDLGVRLKLSPVKAVVTGKRVVVVDDSVVRGTTSKKILRLLRNAGASEVHLRVGAPPVVSPCRYGVATRTYDELLAHRMTLEESRVWMDADSLAYLPLGSVARPGFCSACFSGNYPLI